MLTRASLAVLLASASVSASAAPLSGTHEQVAFPGKTVVAYRQIDRQPTRTVKCHHEASKATVCEAQAAIARQRTAE